MKIFVSPCVGAAETVGCSINMVPLQSMPWKFSLTAIGQATKKPGVQSHAQHIFLGNCLLYSSSRTQKLVSLSSAEAEVYACSSGASDGLLLAGIISWMKQEREMAEQEQTVATQAGNELTAESGNVQANILNETTRTSTTPHQAPDDDEPPHDNEPQQNKGKATHKQQGQNLPADRQLWSSWHTSKTGSRAR